MRGYSLLLYRVRNLGDMIQTLALSRRLPQAAGVFRHRLEAAPEDRLIVFNGLTDKCRPPQGSAPCLFAGVSGPYFRPGQYLQWMANSPYPIGARDPFTLSLMQSAGLRAALIGCATLTLPRYDGPRSGVYSVDYPGPGEPLSHRISRRDSVAAQWRAALEALTRYRTAEAVYTSRLHVALPCLAYGTPVWIANPRRRVWQACRFGIVDAMGLPYEELVTADVSAWARKYIDFLESHLSLSEDSEEPKMPTAPAANGWAPDWWKW